MSETSKPAQSAIPSVDAALRLPGVDAWVEKLGHTITTEAVRDVLATLPHFQEADS